MFSKGVAEMKTGVSFICGKERRERDILRVRGKVEETL